MGLYLIVYDSQLSLPGSWSRAGTVNKLSALIRCPQCNKISSLSGHTIASDGKVTPSVVCGYPDCNFHEFVELGAWQHIPD